MKWSWRIARVAGIGVYLHATFLILLAWVGLSHYLARHSVGDAADGLLFISTLFGIVVLHELGHALLAMRMEYVRATEIAARIGQGLALVFGAVGLFWNPFLLFIMQREFQTADPTEMAETVFARLQACNCHSLPVVQNRQLVGILTAENVGEFLMVQSALSWAVPPKSPRQQAPPVLPR